MQMLIRVQERVGMRDGEGGLAEVHCVLQAEWPGGLSARRAHELACLAMFLIITCMYTYVYVCIYIRMYVCMYVCMCVYISGTNNDGFCSDCAECRRPLAHSERRFGGKRDLI